MSSDNEDKTSTDMDYKRTTFSSSVIFGSNEYDDVKLNKNNDNNTNEYDDDILDGLILDENKLVGLPIINLNHDNTNLDVMGNNNIVSSNTPELDKNNIYKENTGGQETKLFVNKYTFKEVEDDIKVNYFEENHTYSSSLDILASYLKGQKLIYMESKVYCEGELNKLMMPSILLSTSATVLSA